MQLHASAIQFPSHCVPSRVNIGSDVAFATSGAGVVPDLRRGSMSWCVRQQNRHVGGLRVWVL
ncbi:hypothetical protein PYCCODRAFT_1431461 [Trametes coccinea BRFM310]|uniref:Uncharacterized protein n=1 Tax=Trametes coccinea (strain BRFM310) TaxID=1353009 RepID=A0A1Y2IZB9_TRAC3|nr:hypothetical protein PYCCODRAFT_1431461 [Trametes coccinea BRFM310]